MGNTKKMEILNRLIKDGAIDLAEALVLLETEKEYVYIPTQDVFKPFQPFQSDPWIQPYKVTFGTGTTNMGMTSININKPTDK